jgi:hypothetical protein
MGTPTVVVVSAEVEDPEDFRMLSGMVATAARRAVRKTGLAEGSVALHLGTREVAERVLSALVEEGMSARIVRACAEAEAELLHGDYYPDEPVVPVAYLRKIMDGEI